MTHPTPYIKDKKVTYSNLPLKLRTETKDSFFTRKIFIRKSASKTLKS